MNIRNLFLTILLLVLLAGCSGETPEPTADLTIPPATGVPDTPTPAPTAPAEPESPPTLPPAPTLPVPTEEPSATATTEPDPTGLPAFDIYSVVRVRADDTLNVRDGAGVDNDVVGELQPGIGGLAVAGPGTEVDGSLWVPVEAPNGLSGWVNSYFLTPEVPGELFCDAPAPRALVDAMVAAVEEDDEDAFGELIHPERGVHVHTAWYNDPVRYIGPARFTIFSSDEVYEWGMDARGEVSGTFAEVVKESLVRDAVPATEITCNVLEHGGTAGSVIIPDYYNEINYYSLYRPADPDDPSYPLDWGTWAVGIEQWEGEFYVSYLIHYRWEP